jgi:molybdopterin-guanine dinucleotide biosynthesis protein A
MNRQNTVTGVVLAGGMGRRVHEQDKGLLLFQNKPLVEYALQAVSPLVDEVLISANRNLEKYRSFGYSVISDDFGNFEGPLAGILSALKQGQGSIFLILPCDSPLVETNQLQRLLDQLQEDTDIAVASDGQRLHPVFAVMRGYLKTDLENYLLSGERKLQPWLARHSMVTVDFSESPQMFTNLNTLKDLKTLELNL